MKKLMRSSSAKSLSCLYDSIHSSTTDWTHTHTQKETHNHNSEPNTYIWMNNANIIKLMFWVWTQLHSPTCMALLPSLTTSNRVTGSPPSPLCWATPLAFPRPLATPAALSVGDFRGFLLVVYTDGEVSNAGRKQRNPNTHTRNRNIHFQVHTNTDLHTLGVIIACFLKSCSTHSYNHTHFLHWHRLIPGLVFRASLSSSCLSPLDLQSHQCLYLNPLRLLPQIHWTSPWESNTGKKTYDSYAFESFYSSTEQMTDITLHVKARKANQSTCTDRGITSTNYKEHHLF